MGLACDEGSSILGLKVKQWRSEEEEEKPQIGEVKQETVHGGALWNKGMTSDFLTS